MNVQQLIRQLKKLPPNAPVFVATAKRVVPAHGGKKMLMSQLTTVLPDGTIEIDTSQGQPEAVIYSADAPWNRT